MQLAAVDEYNIEHHFILRSIVVNFSTQVHTIMVLTDVSEQ